jgi:tRNA U38,U39,U40 pseudouridine synthase TruA
MFWLSRVKDLEDILLTLPIDVRILGVEYMEKDFTGRAICEKRSIELVFNARDHSFSSSSLRKRVVEEEAKKVRITEEELQQLYREHSLVLDKMKFVDMVRLNDKLAHELDVLREKMSKIDGDITSDEFVELQNNIDKKFTIRYSTGYRLNQLQFFGDVED